MRKKIKITIIIIITLLSLSYYFKDIIKTYRTDKEKIGKTEIVTMIKCKVIPTNYFYLKEKLIQLPEGASKFKAKNTFLVLEKDLEKYEKSLYDFGVRQISNNGAEKVFKIEKNDFIFKVKEEFFTDLYTIITFYKY